MKLRGLGVPLLLALLVGLTPLAYASPPDQTWLSGFYDDADYDDVVIALTSAVGASDGVAAVEMGPAVAVIETLHPSAPSSPAQPFRSPYHLRAPPLV